MVRVVVAREQLPQGSFDDPSFWYVAIQDDDEHEIFRRDFPRDELQKLKGNEPTISLVMEFQSGIIPFAWSIWPVSRSLGWLQRTTGHLAEDDFTIVLEELEGRSPALP